LGTESSPNKRRICGSETAGWRTLETEVFRMGVRDQIVAQVDQLSPEMQEQVLRSVSSLRTGAAKGESGATVRRFAGLLDHGSCGELIQAIEEGCERVDAGEWWVSP